MNIATKVIVDMREFRWDNQIYFWSRSLVKTMLRLIDQFSGSGLLQQGHIKQEQLFGKFYVHERCSPRFTKAFYGGPIYFITEKL